MNLPVVFADAWVGIMVMVQIGLAIFLGAIVLIAKEEIKEWWQRKK